MLVIYTVDEKDMVKIRKVIGLPLGKLGALEPLSVTNVITVFLPS